MLNWFDIVVLIFLLIAFINGYRKGLVMMLAGLVTVVLAAVFGGKLAKIILPQLLKLFDMSPNVANVLSYVAAFLAIAIIISLIGRLIQKTFEAVNLSFINRISGSVVALGTVMVLLSVLLNLVLMLDADEKLIKPDVKQKSFFYERVQAVVPAIVPYLNRDVWENYIPEKYRQQIEKEKNNSEKGNSIDSTFQKKYFQTDSI